MKRIFFAGALLLFSLIDLYSDRPEKIYFKTECSSGHMIKKHGNIRWENFEIDASEIEDEEDISLNITAVSPWIGAGKLKIYGILKEISNPCGYTPGSEIFFEKGEIGIDRSVSAGGRSGFYAKPFPCLCCFCLKRGEPEIMQPDVAGACVNLGISDFLRGDIFFEVSDEDEKSGSGWYMKNQEHGKHEIFNSGGNFIFENKFFALSAAGGLSWGKYIDPGFFGRGVVSAFIKNYAVITFMLSGVSEKYKSPEGALPLSKYRYGGDILLSPFRFLSFSGEYHNDFQMPDFYDVLYNDFSRNISGKVNFFPSDLKFSFSYVRNEKFSNEGILDRYVKYEGSSGYMGDAVRLSFKDAFYFKNSLFIKNSISLSGKIFIKTIKAEASWRRDILPDKTEDLFSEKITLDLDEADIYVALKKEGSSRYLFTTGAAFSF